MNKKYSKEAENQTSDIQKLKEELEGKDNEAHIEYKDLVGNEEYSPAWNHKHPVIENQENKEYQFILSTHEEDFSDYIRYKFEKYGLQNQSVDVQNL